ncbi:MAG: chemotaxis protein CheB [Nanoarchaeota archaeon]
MTLDHVVVIACSRGGREAVIHLDLTPRRSAIILAPHIDEEEIVEDIKRKGRKVDSFVLSETLEPGNIYVYGYHPRGGWSRPTFYFEDDDTLIINRSDYQMADYVMSQAADHYKFRCIGIILSGRGIDGAEGALAIKRNNGKVIVQLEQKQCISGQHKYESGMARNAIRSLEEHGLKPDLVGQIHMLKEYLKRNI